MGNAPRIAIDAMGGDSGPAVMLAGASLSFDRRDDLSFLLFGDEHAIADLICDLGHLADERGFDFLDEVKRGILHWYAE